MRRGFRRWLAALGAAGALLAGLVWYVQPSESETLNLQYSRYQLRHELAEMIRERRTSVVLSEAEINDLLKAELAARRIETAYARLTGARFELVDGGMIAHLKLSAMDRVDIGARLSYALRWQEPDITVQLQDARIKSIPVPAEWIPMPSFTIRLSEMLPPLIGIRSVDFKEDGIVIRFKLDL
jgi:hypothetical protein